MQQTNDLSPEKIRQNLIRLLDFLAVGGIQFARACAEYSNRLKTSLPKWHIMEISSPLE